MGLSLVAMAAAAAGFLSPVAGAVLQEGIDLLVILNALRALSGRRLEPVARSEDVAVVRALRCTHERLRPQVEELAALAARLDVLAPAQAREELRRVTETLETDILPHEREEQATAYPVIARMLGAEDPTGPLIETHHEIQRLTRLLERLVAQLGPSAPGPDEARDLRRALYGLHAILSLHFGQEDELYSMLDRT
jgi:iron-sulfur cluster repair protein YtfE (RIC family)